MRMIAKIAFLLLISCTKDSYISGAHKSMIYMFETCHGMDQRYPEPRLKNRNDIINKSNLRIVCAGDVINYLISKFKLQKVSVGCIKCPQPNYHIEGMSLDFDFPPNYTLSVTIYINENITVDDRDKPIADSLMNNWDASKMNIEWESIFDKYYERCMKCYNFDYDIYEIPAPTPVQEAQE